MLKPIAVIQRDILLTMNHDKSIFAVSNKVNTDTTVLSLMNERVLVWTLESGLITTGLLCDYHIKHDLASDLPTLTFGVDFVQKYEGKELHAIHGPYLAQQIFPDTLAMRETLDHLTNEYDRLSDKMFLATKLNRKIDVIPLTAVKLTP